MAQLPMNHDRRTAAAHMHFEHHRTSPEAWGGLYRGRRHRALGMRNFDVERLALYWPEAPESDPRFHLYGGEELKDDVRSRLDPTLMGWLDFEGSKRFGIKIHMVRAREDYRGKGIAKALFNELLRMYGDQTEYDFGRIIHPASMRIYEAWKRKGLNVKGWDDVRAARVAARYLKEKAFPGSEDLIIILRTLRGHVNRHGYDALTKEAVRFLRRREKDVELLSEALGDTTSYARREVQRANKLPFDQRVVQLAEVLERAPKWALKPYIRRNQVLTNPSESLPAPRNRALGAWAREVAEKKVGLTFPSDVTKGTVLVSPEQIDREVESLLPTHLGGDGIPPRPFEERMESGEKYALQDAILDALLMWKEGGGFENYASETDPEFRRRNEASDRLVKYLSSRKPLPDEIPRGGLFRGIKASAEEIDRVKIGDTISLGAVSSFSDREEAAETFATRTMGSDFRPGVLMWIPKAKVRRGTNINEIGEEYDTQTYRGESEFLTSGDLKIVDIEKRGPNLTVWTVAQI